MATQIIVSIPNGMEFYSSLGYFLQFQRCFNSQRDGILLAPENERYVEAEGFNSQRDGILLFYEKFFRFLKFQVSIPNGMEFYP